MINDESYECLKEIANKHPDCKKSMQSTVEWHNYLDEKGERIKNEPIQDIPLLLWDGDDVFSGRYENFGHHKYDNHFVIIDTRLYEKYDKYGELIKDVISWAYMPEGPISSSS